MRRILAIDDEPEITEIVKLQLESMGGYMVKTENQGTRAIKTAHEFSPDLILLDIMMPDIDGSELAAQILEDKLLRQTPIIFLTALVSEQEVKNGTLGLGPRTYFPKPIDFIALSELIQKTMLLRPTTPAAGISATDERR